MAEIKKKPQNPFISYEEVPQEKGFDKYYIDYEIKNKVKKTGEGDEDYVIEPVIIEHKRLIKEVVNAEVSDVGVEAYLKRLAASGESLPDVGYSDISKAPIVDTTKFPETTGDFVKMSNDAKARFAKLPRELTNGMSYEEFISADMSKLISSYLNKVKSQSVKVSDEKKGENK